MGNPLYENVQTYNSRRRGTAFAGKAGDLFCRHRQLETLEFISARLVPIFNGKREKLYSAQLRLLLLDAFIVVFQIRHFVLGCFVIRHFKQPDFSVSRNGLAALLQIIIQQLIIQQRFDELGCSVSVRYAVMNAELEHIALAGNTVRKTVKLA